MSPDPTLTVVWVRVWSFVSGSVEGSDRVQYVDDPRLLPVRGRPTGLGGSRRSGCRVGVGDWSVVTPTGCSRRRVSRPGVLCRTGGRLGGRWGAVETGTDKPFGVCCEDRYGPRRKSRHQGCVSVGRGGSVCCPTVTFRIWPLSRDVVEGWCLYPDLRDMNVWTFWSRKVKR